MGNAAVKSDAARAWTAYIRNLTGTDDWHHRSESAPFAIFVLAYCFGPLFRDICVGVALGGAAKQAMPLSGVANWALLLRHLT
jgi:hypothetical protein